MQSNNQKHISLKNETIFAFYALVLGIFVGAFVWSFLKILEYATKFLWKYLPSLINIPFYTLILCTAGGIIIGFYRMKFGDYPELLETVISKVKQQKHYRYDNILTV